MRLKELLSGSGASCVSGEVEVDIRSISLDSRSVEPGSLFIAIPGSRTDGNRHVREAVERGAAAVLSELGPPPAPMTLLRKDAPHRPVSWVKAERVEESMGRMACAFYGDPSASLAVVGVTGTNGKTTTTFLLESIFSRCGKTPGVIGTVGHRLGHRLLEKAGNTTPPSLELQRLLARMREGGATHVAMEVSSHGLALKRADEVSFDAAVLTNIARDHLDFHKTPEAYFEAKARLFDLLTRPSSPKPARVAVLNRDDASCARLQRLISGARIATFGFGAGADFRAGGEALTLEGATFRLSHAGRETAIRMRLIGRHNLRNALGAAAAAWSLGLPENRIIEGIAALKRVPGRLEPVEAGQGFSVFVDYAHTEDALAAVLDCLRSLTRGRILTVFGCGGERDAGKRGPMGAAAAAGSDLAIATSDNPRGEDPLEILRQIEEGIRLSKRENYRIVPDRKEAVFEAVRLAQPGDVVLIAGKGHEDAQILGARAVRFDDREVALAALKDSGKC